MTSLRCVLSVLVAVTAVVPRTIAQDTSAPVMTLLVDETQEARRIAFVHEEIRVRPGPLQLAYPKWIPGEHGPTGPIEQFAALRIHSGEQALPWTRDPEEIYTIRVEIPPGVEKISVDFDSLLQNTISDHQLLLAWNTVVLYPRGTDKRELMIEPSVLLPTNWKQASSLRVTGQAGARVSFAPVSLERLIDSPLLAGEFLRVVPLQSSWPAELDFTGDSQAAIDNADKAHAFTLFTNLAEEDRAMFGFRHWEKMHFLVSQSEARPFDGLEHEDSPYDGIGDAGLSKPDQLRKHGFGVLAHEQSHSWDGKYRRPAELYSKPDYQGPERTSLLWVYEGLNQYIGFLLATRAGFNDAAQLRGYLAAETAYLSNKQGRNSTALVDTATENWVLRSVDDAWSSIRRGEDYYDEGALIWLRADTIIREQSHGQHSLDDFLRSFFGQRETEPIVVPYTREDVEASLSAVCPYDWHSFFEKRIYQVNASSPADNLEAAGWRLVYDDTQMDRELFMEDPDTALYMAFFSIGMDLMKDGTIFDVLPGSPAYQAGLGPKMVVVAVDGHAYSGDALNESIAHPQNGKISMLVRNFNSLRSYEIQYTGGLRYPHLERIPGTHDYLSEILQPKAAKLHAQQ